MKKLNNIDAESNKSVAYIKKRVFVCPCSESVSFVYYFICISTAASLYFLFTKKSPAKLIGNPVY